MVALSQFFDWSYREEGAWWMQLGRLLSRLFIIIFLYIILERVIRQFGALPAPLYQRPILLLAAVEYSGWLTLLGIAAAGGWLTINGNLWQSWAKNEAVRPLRWFIITVAFTLVWWFTTYDYNFYLNQPHLVDRFLILICGLMAIWRPAFLFPLLLTLTPTIGQFNVPIGGYSIAQISLPLHIIVLFTAVYCWHLLSKKPIATDFLFLTLCLIAVSYIDPGLGKLRLDWLTHRHLYFLSFASYANGWLQFLPVSSVEFIGRSLAFADWPLAIFTVVVECGAFMLLLRRRTTMLWLVAFILLNGGIWLTSGILFWTWITVNGYLLLWLWRYTDRHWLQIYSLHYVIVAPLMIVVGLTIFRPVTLAWYDVPASYIYRLEAETVEGQTFLLPPRFFAPYDYQYTLSGFSYLSPQANLNIVTGASVDRAVVDALLQAKTVDAFQRIENQLGQVHFDPQRADAFDLFLKRFIGNINCGTPRKTILSWIQPPRQLWTFGNRQAWRNKQPIHKVTIYQVVSLYDGDHYQEIRNQKIREVEIPTPRTQNPHLVSDGELLLLCAATT